MQQRFRVGIVISRLLTLKKNWGGLTHSLQDLSSTTRMEPSPPAVEAQSLNHWTAREVLILNFLKWTSLSSDSDTTVKISLL